jgi:hypothetical protein
MKSTAKTIFSKKTGGSGANDRKPLLSRSDSKIDREHATRSQVAKHMAKKKATKGYYNEKEKAESYLTISEDRLVQERKDWDDIIESVSDHTEAWSYDKCGPILYKHPEHGSEHLFLRFNRLKPGTKGSEDGAVMRPHHYENLVVEVQLPLEDGSRQETGSMAIENSLRDRYKEGPSVVYVRLPFEYLTKNLPPEAMRNIDILSSKGGINPSLDQAKNEIAVMCKAFGGGPRYKDDDNDTANDKGATPSSSSSSTSSSSTSSSSTGSSKAAGASTAE